MRSSWDRFWLGMALYIARERPTCLRRNVGAVLVNENNHIITTGYNGAPSGVSHCTDNGYCLKDRFGVPSGTQGHCRAVHAEANAIIQAARKGDSTEGATLYCTLAPCEICSGLIINAGIKRLVHLRDFPEKLGLKMLAEAGVVVESAKDLDI